MSAKEVGCEGMDWIHMTQCKGPKAGCCVYYNELLGSIKDGDS